MQGHLLVMMPMPFKAVDSPDNLANTEECKEV